MKPEGGELISEIVNPERVLSADIVVGIPSYNEADNIAVPASVASQGLRAFYPGRRAVLVNVDNASPDGTREAFLDTKTEVPKIYVSSPPDLRGKGVNVRNLFRVSFELGAEYVILLDADLKSITPRWIEELMEPLLEGFDFVVPIYSRHKYDGTITNNIVYPMTRMLYGLRVRQPIAGDFAISGKLLRCYLVEKSWTRDVFGFGIDIWLTTVAICRNFNVCQTFLGTPKSHRNKEPASLGRMFKEVVGTMFHLMTEFAYLWKNTDRSRPSVIYGFGLGAFKTPPPVPVDKAALHNSFLKGYERYGHVWKRVLSEESRRTLEESLDLGVEHYVVPADIWVKAIMEFAVASCAAGDEMDEMLDAFIPLYYACTLSYVNRTASCSLEEAELYIDDYCRLFEENKPYLVERWDGARVEGSYDGIARLLRGEV